MNKIASEIMRSITECKRKGKDILQITIPALESIVDELIDKDHIEKEYNRILEILKRNLVIYGEGFDSIITMEELNRNSKGRVKDFAYLLELSKRDEPEIVHVLSKDKETALSVIHFHHCPRCEASVVDEINKGNYYCSNCGQRIKYKKEEKKDGE